MKHWLLSVVISGIFVVATVGLTSCAKKIEIDPNQKIYLGYYQATKTLAINPNQFKSKQISKPHIVSWTADFSTEFPDVSVRQFHKQNIVPMIVWEPTIWSNPGQVTLADIAKGRYDDYFKSWANAIKATQKPVLLVLAPEANSDQYPWGVPNNGKSPKSYKAAYRHIVGLFRSAGISNAIFVWSVLPRSTPAESWNDPMSLYPGDEFVDWVGLASVNQSSDIHTMFSDMLTRLGQRESVKPVMITRYYYEPSESANKALIALLRTDLKSINAIVLSNPKILKTGQLFFKDPLFQASMEEFVYLHL